MAKVWSLIIMMTVIVGLVLIYTNRDTATLRPARSENETDRKVYGGFSIAYIQDYKVDETYKYELLGQGKEIKGVKFTIPDKRAEGTNLRFDTYLSVENIPDRSDCEPADFLSPYTKAESSTIQDNRVRYKVASTTDAAAGNRYEEWVYLLSSARTCRAVRYFIHYTVLENYEPDTVKDFDKNALLNEFDTIRRSLVLE